MCAFSLSSGQGRKGKPRQPRNVIYATLSLALGAGFSWLDLPCRTFLLLLGFHSCRQRWKIRPQQGPNRRIKRNHWTTGFCSNGTSTAPSGQISILFRARTFPVSPWR